MNKLRAVIVAVALLQLLACNKPAPIESVESLVANPERLKELRAQCKADHDKVGDAQCDAVAEATRLRFFGEGGPSYTPPASPPGGFWQGDDAKTAASPGSTSLPPSSPASASSAPSLAAKE